MSLVTNLSDLATAIATDIKDHASRIGNLASLGTTNKSSLVGAINEVRDAAANATGIDDNTTTTVSTWSSSKINTQITSHQPTWGSLADKPSTFPPTIGGTADTAKAGNWVPAWGDVTGKPSFGAFATSTDAGALTGTLPTSVLPPLAITDTFTAANQAAMLALTAQRGDMAIRTDTSQTFVLAQEPASTLANWKELVSPADGVLTVNGKSGPSVSLSKSDIGLGNVDNTSDANKPISSATQAALNAKAEIGTTSGKAADAALIGDTTTNFVSIYNAAKA